MSHTVLSVLPFLSLRKYNNKSFHESYYNFTPSDLVDESEKRSLDILEILSLREKLWKRSSHEDIREFVFTKSESKGKTWKRKMVLQGLYQ